MLASAYHGRYTKKKYMSGQYTELFTVEDKDCISEINDTLPKLLGTYTIVKWMEITCTKNILKQLNENQISVGDKVSIEHSGMVENGEKVKISSTIESQGKRKVYFTVSYSDTQ